MRQEVAPTASYLPVISGILNGPSDTTPSPVFTYTTNASVRPRSST